MRAFPLPVHDVDSDSWQGHRRPRAMAHRRNEYGRSTCSSDSSHLWIPIVRAAVVASAWLETLSSPPPLHLHPVCDTRTLKKAWEEKEMGIPRRDDVSNTESFAVTVTVPVSSGIIGDYSPPFVLPSTRRKCCRCQVEPLRRRIPVGGAHTTLAMKHLHSLYPKKPMRENELLFARNMTRLMNAGTDCATQVQGAYPTSLLSYRSSMVR